MGIRVCRFKSITFANLWNRDIQFIRTRMSETKTEDMAAKYRLSDALGLRQNYYYLLYAHKEKHISMHNFIVSYSLTQ